MIDSRVFFIYRGLHFHVGISVVDVQKYKPVLLYSEVSLISIGLIPRANVYRIAAIGSQATLTCEQKGAQTEKELLCIP